MNKTNLFLLILSVIFIAVASFVIWDTHIKDDVSATSNNQSQITTTQNDALQNTSANTATTKKPKQNNTTKKQQSNKTAQNTTTNAGAAVKKTEFASVVDFTETNLGSVILGRPTENSIAFNIIAVKGTEAYIEYSTSSGIYSQKTNTYTSLDGNPIVIEITSLGADMEYYYRVNYHKAGQTSFIQGKEYTFHTARLKGDSFTFDVQGDSHPERTGKMFSSDLYEQTMNNVLLDNPDLYFTVGDDFSIENLIDKNTLTVELVDRVYLHQRNYLGIIGSSVPLFLVNGNHEQAAKYLLDGTANNAAVLAANSRIKNYPLPIPNGFYSGDTEQVEFVGSLRDYYAFTWGDALFITIDPYWHSDVPVDNVAGNDSAKRSDLWDITLGDEQYQWFKKNLEESDAKYKFVFTHHVLGTGRGGIENAKLYEWGGYGGNGVYEFNTKRPTWDKPIHQLMVDNGVSIFFQGHDHIFAYQTLDGVVYQSLPNPADDTYTAFNPDAYTSGDKLPNSGHIKISVTPEKATVNYVRSFLPGDGTNGQVAYSYEVLP
jgi:hypothetical protein